MSESSINAEIRTPAVYLLKGILYRQQHLDAWNLLLQYRERLRTYFTVLGLELIVEEGDGYAYLRQSPGEEEEEQPRLMSRRRLPYQQTLLIVLLRKRLLEFEADGSELRLVLRYADIADMMRLYWNDKVANERKQEDKLRTDIKKLASYGFLRPLKAEHDRYEVNRVLKAYVPIEKLNEILEQLQAYAEAQNE